jgi:Cu/Ag efflux protein CusF
MVGVLEENKDIETITFNALGAGNLEEKLAENYILSNDYSNIENYTYKGELVSKIKDHFGNVYEFDTGEILNPFHKVEVHDNDDDYELKENSVNLIDKAMDTANKMFKPLSYYNSYFNLPSLDLNFKKTDSKQSLIQQKPSFDLENFNFTKEEIRQATNITLPSAITSHPEIVIKSNYNKATNTRVNNIDLNFGKITINSDEDIKNLAYYCCDLAHNLEQCVLSKIKRELQIKPN